MRHALLQQSEKKRGGEKFVKWRDGLRRHRNSQCEEFILTKNFVCNSMHEQI